MADKAAKEEREQMEADAEAIENQDLDEEEPEAAQRAEGEEEAQDTEKQDDLWSRRAADTRTVASQDNWDSNRRKEPKQEKFDIVKAAPGIHYG